MSCSSDNDEPGHHTPPPVQSEAVSRTVLVYMVADNSLGQMGCDKADLAEMRRGVDAGALGAKGRLLIYHNRPGTTAGLAPVLVEMRQGGITDTLKTYPDDISVYSIDVNRMNQVFNDVENLAPSDSKGLVLWSHGSGWQQTGNSRSASHPMLYSFGEDRGKTMKISSLATALKGRGFDFVYFDCCFMASVEVAYELRYCVPEMAASVTELPVDGTTYDLNLEHFFKSPKADLVSAARTTFNHYNGLSGSERTCTMSVLDLSQMDYLANATRRVFEAKLDKPIPNDGIQKYMRNDRVCTLFDMDQYIETLCADDLQLLDQWREALSKVIIFKACTPSIFDQLVMERHCGLGTYIIGMEGGQTFRGYDQQSWWNDVVCHAPAFSSATKGSI